MRLDKYLFEKGYFTSRNRVQEAIKNGLVKVNGVVQKKNYLVQRDDIVDFEKAIKYVSRAGEKLEHALCMFNINVNDRIILDVGSSTGGFTDCLIQNGAKHIYCIDVGKNQLHQSLRGEKVTLHEGTNILDVEDSWFVLGSPDLIVMDVSFVSVTKIIPHILNFADELIVLIKPQFESKGKHLIKGVIKSKKVHKEIIDNLVDFINSTRLFVTDITESPIRGKEGNIEFLFHISNNKGYVDPLVVIEKAHGG